MAECEGDPDESVHNFEKFYRDPDYKIVADIVCSNCGCRPIDLLEFRLIPTPAEKAFIDVFFPKYADA